MRFINIYIYIYIYIFLFCIFQKAPHHHEVSGAPAVALPEKCEKVKPFMQTNVRLPPDTLAGASQ